MKCRKARYSSRSIARKALKKIKGAGLACDGLRPYRCDECAGMWHLGHLPGAVIAGRITRAEAYRESR